VANGAISGLGMMAKVKFIAVIGYWVLGIPLSVYSMFNLGLGI
jgi:Na+-driven multidrug efflux pump